jgi:hypothetical protein
MTPDEAAAKARFAVKIGAPIPPEIVGVLLAELDARGVAIERVRELVYDSGGWTLSCQECAVGPEIAKVLDGRP